MNDTDFETMLKSRIVEQVDARLGARRNAPPFEPTNAARPATAGRTGARWVRPLLVAATVAAVVGGSFAVAAVFSDTATTTPTGGSRTHTVHVGGATIPLPRGWIARPYERYLPKGLSTAASQQWCLTPASSPPSRQPGACALTFGTIDPNGPAIDVDQQTGYLSDAPQYCAPHRPSYTELAAPKSFGGRDAEWREWYITCVDNTTKAIEQYVVPTDPGYVLYSEHAVGTTDRVMTDIAQHAAMPKPASNVRLSDRGYVRAIAQHGRTWSITIDRVQLVMSGTKREIRGHLGTWTYRGPRRLFIEGAPQLGTLVYLATNGSQLTQLSYERPR